MFLVETAGAGTPVSAQQAAAFILYPGVTVSVDALLLAIENDADIVLMGTDGKVHGRIWNHRFGSISTIRRRQLEFCRESSGMQWIRRVITRKIKNQMAVLEVLQYERSGRQLETGLKKMQAAIERIQASETGSTQFKSVVRSAEAAASKVYWAHIGSNLPVAYAFKGRSQHPALDAFNAMLNYAYGILYALCEKALILAGLDPYLGVLHADIHNRPVLVYDFIEQYRHWADYVVIRLCVDSAIGQECLDTETSGACRLNPLGARIVAQCFHDYMAEVMVLDQISRARKNHIELDAQKLATHIANTNL